MNTNTLLCKEIIHLHFKAIMKHILVFRLSAMGDVAMTVPVIRALIEQHPEVRVTVVSRPFFKPFFNGIDRVDFFAIDLNQRHKGFVGLIRLYKDLKKLHIDAFADLHNVLRSIVVRHLFKLSGVKVAHLDKGRNEKKALTRLENKIFKSLKAMHQRYAEVFEKLGFTVNIAQANYPAKPVLSEKIISLTGAKNQKWIGIAPFAQYDTKVYPLDLMQEVVNKLAANAEHKLFLFGGKTDVANMQKLQNNHPNVEFVFGKLSFQEELDLIAHLDVMLSMDSGNAHIASMYGVKTIVLFGATHPYAGFMPFGQPLDNALTPDRNQYPKLPTSVYGNKIVEGYQDAMRTITPAQVVQAVTAIFR